jgi:peptidoglycan/xylan/chitin deacetylase (PgdA/CDA1 family)
MLIFNLHHVEPVIRHPDRQHISVTPRGLRWIIRTLRWAGLEIVSLRDVLACPDAKMLGANKVLLTLDDGYENNYLYAAPVFEAEQCPATIFALPGRFSGSNEWDQGHLPVEEQDKLMSLEQMKKLARTSKYITFGSHGMMHVHFPELDEATLRHEIDESYAILSRELGDAFLPAMAYPWGESSPAVVKAMASSPYKCAFTVEKSLWSVQTQRFEIPRHSLYFRDGNPLVLLAKLFRHNLLSFDWNGISANRRLYESPSY